MDLFQIDAVMDHEITWIGYLAATALWLVSFWLAKKMTGSGDLDDIGDFGDEANIIKLV